MAALEIDKPWGWSLLTKHSRMSNSSTWRSRHTTTGHTLDFENARNDQHSEKFSGLDESYTFTRRALMGIGKAVLLILQALSSLLSLLRFLLPRQGRPARRKASHELHPMSYLDALRGYLAMIIFTGHTMSRRWRWIPNSILAVPWLQFPFRGGHASLDMFFWISGYAITYRIIGFMQAKKPDKVLDTLASSIFRRYLRLFLPVAITTFVTTVALATGVAVTPRHKKDVFVGNLFWLWVKDTAQAVNPFTQVGGWWTLNHRAGSNILDQFWSINTEFRSSMIMFAFCTATCKMSSRARKRLIWLCIPVLLAWQVQWLAMAFFGMWCAERRQQEARAKAAQKSLITDQSMAEETITMMNPLHDIEKEKLQHRTRRNLPMILSEPTTYFPNSLTTITRRHTTTLSRLHTPILFLTFLSSFYVMQDPHENHQYKTFPHNLINRFVLHSWAWEMKMHFHLLIGASMMLYPLDQLPALQRPLLTLFSQWLGELSFGIYAVHITVRFVWWEPRYLKWVGGMYPGDFDHFWILFPGYVVMALMVLWAAEAFRRIDVRVVGLCRDLEVWLFE